MAITFLIGRAGSGKTRLCAGRIADSLRQAPLGPRIYWLLPKQATFIAERQLACGMDLPGFCRARVLSFEQFAEDVLNDCGGSSIPQIDSLGRQMALGHLLRKHEGKLRFFQSVARQPGLAAELDATLAELDRCGCDPADMRTAVESDNRPGDPESISLRDKLADLALLSKEYHAFLGTERLDQHARLEKVLNDIARCSFIANADFYVDGFTEFTDAERKMLVAIGRAAASLHITLTINPASRTVHNFRTLPSDMSVFHRTEMTYHRLRTAFEKAILPADVALLGEPTRFTSAATRIVEKRAFADDGRAELNDAEAGLPQAPALVEAPSRAAEVDAAAREIVRLVAQEKLRYRDIAVMVRSPEPYLGLIDAAFAEHRIPWFADRRRTAAHHPLLQLLRSLIQIVRFDWPHDAVMTMLKGGLAGVDGVSADTIENYVLRHGLVGSAWTTDESWNYRQELMGPQDVEDSDIPPAADSAATVDAIRRRLVAAIAPLNEALASPQLSVRRIASETFACLERLGARQELQRWMEAATADEHFEQAAEHEQVWARLVELFEQMVDLLGDEPMGIDDFAVVLDSGLEQFDLALAPATVDQVLIGQVDRTHAPAIKACLVLGLSKGEFPAVAHDPTVLSDRERRSLARRNVELSPGTRRQQLDEAFLGYTAFTRASQWLWVSRPTSIAGREAAPSQFWHRLRQLFPDAQPIHAPDPAHIDANDIATPRQLITGVMRWARQIGSTPSPDTPREGRGGGEAITNEGKCPLPNPPPEYQGRENPSGTIWPALYTLLADYPPRDDAIDAMRFRAWKALAYDNSAHLSASAARLLFPRPLPVSVAQLETFAACPFQHFVQFGLRLQPRAERQVSARELSNVYHDLLHRLIASAISKAGEGLQPITADTVRTEADQLAQRLAQELFTGNGRNAYLLRTIERAMQRIIASQQAVLERGKFCPSHVGVSFGEGRRYPALGIVTPRGERAMVHGRIDRIDSCEGARAVVDYRLSTKGLDLEQAYYGISIRLLANLLAMDVCIESDDADELHSTAALEIPLVRRLKRVDDPADAPAPGTPEFLLAQPPKGIVAESAARDFDSAWTSGQSPILGANIKKDGTRGKPGILMDEDRLTDLLRFAWRRIGELADEILAGQIDIHPYRLRNRSPCARCDYRAVCRFEQRLNRYHSLKVIPVDDLWVKIRTGGDNDA